MNYEITASLGPASAAPETWRAMTAAGASSFRLNTSHLDASQLDGWRGWKPFARANSRT